MKTTRAALLLSLLLTGCSIEYLNQNNGQAKVLTFDRQRPEEAVGGAFTVSVRAGDEGLFECSSSFSFMSVGGGGGCSFIGEVTPLSGVLTATCADEMCTATIGAVGADGRVPVQVTALKPGTAVLSVKALVADGNLREDSHALTFNEQEPISLTCASRAGCPGPHAIFVGASVHWQATLPSTSNPPNGFFYAGAVDVEAVPAGIVEVERTWPTEGAVRSKEALNGAEIVDDVSQLITRITLRAVAPGQVELVLRDVNHGRRYERRIALKVVSPEEAVRGEVHHLAPPQRGAMDEPRADSDLAGALAAPPIDPMAFAFVPVWTLRDGTTALGAAGRVTPVGTHWAPQVPTNLEPVNADDLSHRVFLLDPTERASDRRFTATVGGAALDFTFPGAAAPMGVCPESSLSSDISDFSRTIRLAPTVHIEWEQEGHFPRNAIRINATQQVSFEGVLDSHNRYRDDLLLQECGPAVVLERAQFRDAVVRFSVPGVYRFRGGWNGDGQVTRLAVEVVR